MAANLLLQIELAVKLCPSRTDNSHMVIQDSVQSTPNTDMQEQMYSCSPEVFQLLSGCCANHANDCAAAADEHATHLQ